MDKKALEAFAREAAKSIKTPSDLDDFRKMLTKVTVETALNAEHNEHLAYDKNS
ncbi:IS256 family transposase, partial [Pseudoalteromonas citrea]